MKKLLKLLKGFWKVLLAIILFVMFNSFAQQFYAKYHWVSPIILRSPIEKNELISPLPKGKKVAFIDEAFAQEPGERITKLQKFLKAKNSPLAEHAEVFVYLADKYALDYTLAVAISGKESSFGKNIKQGSHNAWGYMTWDAQGTRSVKVFSSWEEGIEAEIKLLAENYKVRMNKGIQEAYCPSYECSSTWVAHVTNFQEEINKEVN